MQHKRLVYGLFFGIFLLATLFRLYPAWLNRDANDDHFEVIEIIAYENRIPGKEELDCLQCYHPKLFHWSAAKLVNIFHADPGAELKIISQFLSVGAGLLTLVIAYLFLVRLPIRETTRLISLLLLALHPALIAVNIQATNDSFVILFSSLALFSLFLFLQRKSWPLFVFMTSAVILAGLSKGSGLILFLGILFILATVLISEGIHRKPLIQSALFFGAFLIAVPIFLSLFGPYDEHLTRYGSPLVINKEKSPAPHFFEETFVGGKTGLTSVYQGYFTFHWLDLIRTPYLDRESIEGHYPPSRTSLWTQLYARTTFIQYEGRPRDWFTKLQNPVYDLGRIIFVVALVPLALFLLGIILDTRTRLRQLRSRFCTDIIADPTWIFSFFFWGFLLFIIKFTFEYRELSAMKPIYMYPALLAFLFLFAQGLEQTLASLQNKYLRTGVLVSLVFLALLFLIDIWFLTQKLS